MSVSEYTKRNFLYFIDYGKLCTHVVNNLILVVNHELRLLTTTRIYTTVKLNLVVVNDFNKLVLNLVVDI